MVWKTLGDGLPVVNVNGPRYGAIHSGDRRLIGLNNIELITDRPLETNFREIADTFLASGAAVRLEDEGQLEEAFLGLLGDPVRRARLGAAARALVEANRGAKDKTMTVLERLVQPAAPSNVIPFRPIA